MIKFFRRIRYRLLNGNSFSKYFFYALGEIILVMIGILLALQVNNWNEERKISEIEKQTLLNIQTELEKNLEKTKDNSERNQAILDSLKQFLLGEFDSPTLKEKAQIIYVINNHSPLQLNMPALEQELNISPKIINYPAIREKLFEVSYLFTQVTNRLGYLDDTWTRYISPLMTSDGMGRSFLNFFMDLNENNYQLGTMWDVPNYDDILSIKYSQMLSYNNWMENLIDSQEEALELIENKLMSND